MPSNTLYLSATDEAIVLGLKNIVLGTTLDDLHEQRLFLDGAAKSLLVFRPFVASFASTPAVGAIVFLLRTRMRRNDRLLGALPTAIYRELQEFIDEILLHRRLSRNSGDSASVAIDVDRPDTPDLEDDVISIPSSDDDTDILLQPTPVRPPVSSLVSAGPNDFSKPLLSPLPVLDSLLFSLETPTPPPSPTFTTYSIRSQPRRAPIELPALKSCVDRPPTPFAVPHPAFSTRRPDPRTYDVPGLPTIPTGQSLYNWVDNWNGSNPRSINYYELNKPGKKRGRQGRKGAKPRRCYICFSPQHPVAECPFHGTL